MRAMASNLFSYLKCHPLITAISVLLLCTLPIFHMLMFFWPLIVSTVLGVLAVISFGRQSTDEHVTPIAACGSVESAWQPDIITLPSHEENIFGNMLMVGNQEVTWLEWLHNQDTQKLCTHECEPAVWDEYGCDCSTMATVELASRATIIDASNGSTCMDEAVDDASFQAKDKGRLNACGSRGEGENHVSALVLTEENELRAMVPPSTVWDGFSGTAIVLEEEETKMNAPILTAENGANHDLTGEDHMCTRQNGIVFTGNTESNTHSRACTDQGDEGQMSVEGFCLTKGGGNECKATMLGSLNLTIHTKNEVNSYTSVGGDEVMGIVKATNECNIIGNSLESTIDTESTLNKCVLEDKTSLHVSLSTLQESTEDFSHTSELKISDTHEQDALDLRFPSKTISPLLEVKGAKVHEMRHVVQQDEVERGSNQFETQGPQWDVSDGEEDRSSLRFSFFHNSSLTPSEA